MPPTPEAPALGSTRPLDGPQSLAALRLPIVAQHYATTVEHTHTARIQRDRTFLVLLVVISAGTLLTYDVAESHALLADALSRWLDLSDARRIRLAHTFPFRLLGLGLGIAVFYLMANLYQHTVTVLRNYRYIGMLEAEIRDDLDLDPDAVAFSRESEFYWGARPLPFSAVKFVYIGILGGLLTIFLAGRLFTWLAADWTGSRLAGNAVLVLAEAAVGAASFYFFVGYVGASRDLDHRFGAPPGSEIPDDDELY